MTKLKNIRVITIIAIIALFLGFNCCYAVDLNLTDDDLTSTGI